MASVIGMIALAPMAIAADKPALSQAELIRMADLCEATEGAGHEAFAAAALRLGFEPAVTIRREIEAFYGDRSRAYTVRNSTNKTFKDHPDGALASDNNIETSVYARSDGWTVILRSPTHLVEIEGNKFGDAHACSFFGYGWITETDAEVALATLVGEDFGGRGRTIPGDDWSYLFSGFERGGYPRSEFTMTAVQAPPGGLPTFTLGYVVVRDMTIPPEVWTAQ